MPITLHRLFTVPAAGTTTVHIMAQSILATWEFNKMQLSLVYLPTSYGMVAPLADGGPGTENGADDGARSGIAAGEPGSAPAELRDLLNAIRQERAALEADLDELHRLEAESDTGGRTKR